MAKLFKTAFAYQGTKEQLPDSAQPDGKASFAEGFTDDYTLDYGDADARDIAQSELNGIFHDVTEAIGELQKYGVAVWQSDMTPIAKYSLVFHDGKLWQAKKNTSATPASGADWQMVDIADIVSQLGTLDLNDYATKTYVDSAVNGLASTSYVDSAVAPKATARVVNAQLAGKFDKTDVAQESGQSTTKVMSQKAVTDALSDAAAGQLSWGAITGDIENQGDLQDALALKIDKEEGKGLSTNDYSDADKAKLTSLEGSHFRGVYINEAALSEIADPVAGDYADVDAGAGSDAERWIYDVSDSKWIVQESASSLTASQVKQLYESNADTNAFNDDDKSKLSDAAQKSANLSDLANASTARTNLGLGAAATSDIAQVTGQSTTDVMSQKVVTDALEGKVDKVQTKEIVTANKTLTAADSGKLLIINSDGITITMTANSNFNVDIAKMDEDFITIVQCVGTDKFREGTATISVIRDVSITNSGIAGKEWLAIGAYEV